MKKTEEYEKWAYLKPRTIEIIRFILICIGLLIWSFGTSSAYVVNFTIGYNSSVYETATENYFVNVTYNPSIYTSISGALNYAGTEYSATKVGTGANILFTKSLDVPLYSSGSSQPLFWKFTIVNSTGTFYEQTNTSIPGSVFSYFMTDDDSSSGVTGNDWRAQTFTIGSPGTNSTFNVSFVALKGSSSVNGNLVVGIKRVDGTGQPTGNDVANGTFDTSALTGTQWFNVSVTPQYNLSQGAKYALVIRHGDSGDFAWREDTANGYASGSRWESANAGSTWTETATRDLMFAVYDESGYKSQAVGQVNLALCNSTYSVSYMNFSFKNETTAAENVNASFTGSFTYYLGGGSVSKGFSFTNATENPRYSLCFKPADKRLSCSVSATYANSESPQRSYTQSAAAFTNTTTLKTLYLLPSSAGIYVTFQVINPAQQIVSDALTSVYSGSTLIETRQTDSSGGATFFLNPLVSYNITVSKTGYTTTSTQITPTQSSYTITLSPTSTSTGDYSKGISISTAPIISNLVNDTTYNFNYTLTSTFWTVSLYGFTITNSSSYILNSVSDTSNGGTVSLNLNTGTNNSLFMNYYYVINGTYNNFTRAFYVENLGDTSWSLKYLFTDLSLYLTSGLFGLDNFGLAIIIFLTIFIITGVMSFKYGFTSPAAIMGLIFGLVLLFDVGLGLIPNPVGAVPNFPTILTLLIFISIFVKEALY